MLSDSELVKAVLAGQVDLFEPLVIRYEASIKAICFSVLGDSHLAADATQDAFIKAYEKLATLQNQKVFGAWLMRIAKRRALDMLKQQQTNMAQTPDPPSASTEQHYELDERKDRLLKAMMDLPEHERQVLMLRYFEEQSVRNVATISGRSLGTITKQLSRAHRRLKTILQEAE